MKLFFSYARVDRLTAFKIIELVDIHDVWYDQRLYVGEKWWPKIVEEIEKAEGFVYLISPDSLKSKYCNKELALAANQGKHIFPVLIQPVTDLPKALAHLTHIDMTEGLNPVNVKSLLNTVTLAERNGVESPKVDMPLADNEPTFNPATFLQDATEAIRKQDFDTAVYLLRLAKERKLADPTNLVSMMLKHAEEKLEKQTYNKAAQRDYETILALVNRPGTQELGCQAFTSFREKYPDYDPNNIASICSTTLLPNLTWCTVPNGEISLSYETKRITYHVYTFKMSQYPITNSQFQMFIDASDGYCDSKWWDFSHEACMWRKYNKVPMSPAEGYGDHPRVNVCWYEAMAFCRWLSHKTGMNIALPTEPQWKRAAQGDDTRLYPWGNRFDSLLCNTRDSKIKRTTDVRRYAKGASPYGVMDMAGNVWEWCRNMPYGPTTNYLDLAGDHERVARGGSYSSQRMMVRNNHHMIFAPDSHWNTVGFRVVAES